MRNTFHRSALATGPAWFKWVSFALFLLAVSLLNIVRASIVPGTLRDLPQETTTSRKLRHDRIAERRAGTLLIAHRGACTLATENTLEAYAAAMDYGADGCEMDIRRTADGVLVMFHDDILDHLTDGFGAVEDLTYTELLALHPRSAIGTATRRTRPPTFAAVLVLARQRAMLLHLDVKRTGLDDEIARMLDEADVWDHVVAVNRETLPKLLTNPKLKLLRYKGAVYENRQDADPAALRAAIARPGQMIILEDPRVAVSELRRVPYQPVPLPAEVFVQWKEVPFRSPPKATNFIASDHLRLLRKRINPGSVTALQDLLRPDDPHGRGAVPGLEHEQRPRAERILERAWAAERLGQMAPKSSLLVRQLEHQVRHPGLHRDWMINAVDGHTAARALGRLRATEAVPVLIEAFRRVDPGLIHVRNPQWTNNPISWVDWRKQYLVTVLGELPCDASKSFLLEYVAMNDAAANEVSIPSFEEATKALLRQKTTRSELRHLLKSHNSAVRGTTILECLDHPNRDRTAALREAASWALSLPRARK